MMENRRWYTALALLVIGAAIVALWQTGYWARSFVTSDIRERSVDILNLVVENLRGELAKFQYQPRLLATDPDLERALSNNATGSDVGRANEKLVRSNDVSGAVGTFLLDRSGRTLAASDWEYSTTLVGGNFSYRPYFHQAMQGSLGRDFGFDPDTGERSYYFAHPVRSGSAILGAVAIKVPIDRLEPSWHSSDYKILVVDRDGVIFLSSHPDWRFRSLRPLSDDAKNRLVLDRTYGAQEITPLPISGQAPSGMLLIRDTPWASEPTPQSAPSTLYLVQSKEMNEAGWRVLILSDVRGAGLQANIWRAIVAFMIISLVLLLANIYQRRRRYAERLALQEAAKGDLEVQVAERTADLTEVNIQLRSEISERHKTETRLRHTQAELVQAAKLAALGQMSAGLSHELNQPLTAIRSYSDNARTYLERGQTEPAESNLKSISELTERMGRIIKNLRTYARGEPVALRAISVNDALSEALGLLDTRIIAEKVTVSTQLPQFDATVTGGAVRLQQILVNLISNALDAVQHTDTKQLHLSVDVGGADVNISVRDSGPGIVKEEIDKLFDPFYSTKEVGAGMGLGLSITFGIVKQFGGEILAENHADGGAVFTVTLRRADAATGAAA